MVKGIAKRVVVVRFSDVQLFEQAILLMRDGCENEGVTEAQILEEANELAAQVQREQAYQPVQISHRSRLSWGARIFCLVWGAGLASLVWVLVH
ncbi:MAG: hypothetical protein FWE06_06070 [Oscillospiraceae bacterium]|nr:hypothetical protein [Oscillospiraceae bacterium]